MRMRSCMTPKMVPAELAHLKCIGRGFSARVLEHPKYSERVLICTPDGIKKDWLVRQHGCNLGSMYMDITYAKHYRLGEVPIYVVEMPKLKPFTKSQREKNDALARALRGWQFTVNSALRAHESTPLQLPEILKPLHAQLETLYYFVHNYAHVRVDLHLGNILQTRKHLIITDPVVDDTLSQWV